MSAPNVSDPRIPLGAYTSEQIDEMRDLLLTAYDKDAGALACEILMRMSAAELTRLRSRTITSFDALPADVRKQLVDLECMEGEGRPKGATCAPWQAERFLRALTSDQLRFRVEAMRKVNMVFRPQWDHPPHNPGMDCLDVPGIGRYLVRREDKGSRVFRAYLNNARTSYTGSRVQVRKAVERAIAQAEVVAKQKSAEF